MKVTLRLTVSDLDKVCHFSLIKLNLSSTRLPNLRREEARRRRKGEMDCRMW